MSFAESYKSQLVDTINQIEIPKVGHSVDARGAWTSSDISLPAETAAAPPRHLTSSAM